jgi:hypothetical protein
VPLELRNGENWQRRTPALKAGQKLDAFIFVRHHPGLRILESAVAGFRDCVPVGEEREAVVVQAAIGIRDRRFDTGPAAGYEGRCATCDHNGYLGN